MFIWYSSSQCGTLLSSYQCIFVKSHHRIELASNPKASCSLWPLAVFLSSSSKIFSCLWSLLLLSCQLSTLGHPAFSEAERALWHSLLNSYWSLLLLDVLFNSIVMHLQSLFNYETIVIRDGAKRTQLGTKYILKTKADDKSCSASIRRTIYFLF